MTDIIEGTFRESTALAVHAPAPIAAPQLLDALRPAERVALMTEISDVLADVITKKKWFVDIKGKKHITIHGWTFVGSLAGCSVKTTHYEPIEGGYKAHASVVRVDSGIEVGSAEQVCMKNESFGRGKDDYALIGMASTRACSRALSTAFRHVVELAGYSATPAEEMGKDDPPSDGRITPREITAAEADEIRAMCKARGLKIVAFIATVVPGFDKRENKTLNVAEYAMVKVALARLADEEDATAAADPQMALARVAASGGTPTTPVGPTTTAKATDDDRKVTPRTNGRLFALLDERLSTEKEARLIFAAEHGVVTDSFSRITEAQARHLIAQLEMLPDPSAALDAYAREKGIV